MCMYYYNKYISLNAKNLGVKIVWQHMYLIRGQTLSVTTHTNK
jgi:hypothetical protein